MYFTPSPRRLSELDPQHEHEHEPDDPDRRPLAHERVKVAAELSLTARSRPTHIFLAALRYLSDSSLSAVDMDDIRSRLSPRQSRSSIFWASEPEHERRDALWS